MRTFLAAEIAAWRSEAERLVAEAQALRDEAAALRDEARFENVQRPSEDIVWGPEQPPAESVIDLDRRFDEFLDLDLEADPARSWMLGTSA